VLNLWYLIEQRRTAIVAADARNVRCLPCDQPDAARELALFFKAPEVDSTEASPPLGFFYRDDALLFRNRYWRGDRIARADSHALSEPVLEFVGQVPDSRAAVKIRVVRHGSSSAR
jgi:hypothetical protein